MMKCLKERLYNNSIKVTKKDTKRRLKELVEQKIVSIQITGNKVWVTTGNKYSQMVYRIK